MGVDVVIFTDFMTLFLDFLASMGTNNPLWDYNGNGIIDMTDFLEFLAHGQPTDWVNGTDPNYPNTCFDCEEYVDIFDVFDFPGKR